MVDETASKLDESMLRVSDQELRSRLCRTP